MEEEELGTFEAGELADFAMLSADYLTIPDDGFRRLRSVLTLQEGRVVHF